MITLYAVCTLIEDAEKDTSGGSTKILMKALANIRKNGKNKGAFINIVSNEESISDKMIKYLKKGTRHLMTLKVKDVGLTKFKSPYIFANVLDITFISDKDPRNVNVTDDISEDKPNQEITSPIKVKFIRDKDYGNATKDNPDHNE